MVVDVVIGFSLCWKALDAFPELTNESHCVRVHATHLGQVVMHL